MSEKSDNSYKEWLDTSIQEGSIYCCPESDIELDPQYIGLGAYGVVHKATIKRRNGLGNVAKTIFGKRRNSLSGMTVAVKILYPDKHGKCQDDLHRRFVEEVVVKSDLLSLPDIHICLSTKF